jgi:hypothetical protein
MGHLRLSLPMAHGSVLGEEADDSSVILWSVAVSSSAEGVDRQAVAWGAAILPNKGG